MKRQPYEDNSPWQTTYGSAYNVNHYPNNDIIFNNALDNQVNPPYQNIPQNKNLYRNIHGELESLNDSTEYFINKAKSVKQYFYIEYQNPEFRNYMEDKGKSFDCFSGFSQALFCLFDGHQNDSISSYLQDNFHNEFRTLLKLTNNQFTKQNIYDLFAKIDLKFKENSLFANSGSTACIVYITDGEIFCFNIGDTKCVLFSGKNYEKLTIDDRVSNKNEVERIKKEGGVIFNDRVCGNLMLTRSFGDFEFKKFGVISEPHLKVVGRVNNQILVIATDGIWDFLSDEDVFNIVNKNGKKDVNEIGKIILNEALKKGSQDNISLFVVKL